MGKSAAMAIDPPYAAALAFPAAFFVLALGSTLTLRLRDVDVVDEAPSYDGISAGEIGLESLARLLLTGPVVKAVAEVAMTANTKK